MTRQCWPGVDYRNSPGQREQLVKVPQAGVSTEGSRNRDKHSGWSQARGGTPRSRKELVRQVKGSFFTGPLSQRTTWLSS